MKQSEAETQRNRRSFLKKGALAGGAVAIGAGLMSSDARAFDHHDDERLTPGDATNTTQFEKGERDDISYR